MPYEPLYERFEAAGPDGQKTEVAFLKSGFLAAGDQPELYFFRLGEREVIVGISGQALLFLQKGRRYLSREEKIDVAGLFLQQRIRAGLPLVAKNLSIGEGELAALVGELGLAL
jgi:hypothetical protein